MNDIIATNGLLTAESGFGCVNRLKSRSVVTGEPRSTAKLLCYQPVAFRCHQPERHNPEPELDEVGKQALTFRTPTPATAV